MSFIKNSFWTFITLVATALLGIIWSIITARVLEPQGIGILAIVTLYPLLFYTISHITFGVGTIYHVGQKKYPVENFAMNSLFMAIVMGILSYIVFVVTLPIFKDTLYKGIDSSYLYLAFSVVIFNLIVYQMSSVLQGIGCIKEYNIINLIRFSSALFGLIILVVALKFGLYGAICAFVGSFVISAITAIIILVRKTKQKWQLNFSLLKDTLRSSGKLHIASVATFLYGQVGLMIANYYLTSVEVGYLYVALVYTQFLFIIPQAIQIVLYPMTNSATEEDAKELSIKVCRHAVLWVFIGAVVFGLLSEYIITILIGDSYLPVVIPLLILLPGVVLFTIAQVIAPLWVRKGLFWIMCISGVFIAIVNIVLNLIFIPMYGVNGMAMCNSLTYFIGFLIVLLIYYYYVDKKIFNLFVIRRDDFKMYRDIFTKIGGIVFERT